MQSRILVVGCVITIVEEQKVKARASEVARVIVLGPGVRVDMLNEIEKHDRRRGTDCRQYQRTAPNVKSQPGLLPMVKHRSQYQHGYIGPDPERILKTNS